MIKLLSTDFDGTVIDHFSKPAVSPAFLEALVALNQRGVLWAVNTGRELAHIVEGLREFSFPVEPDFVLTAEREVFHRGPNGLWQDYGDWNARCVEAHDVLFSQAGQLLSDIHDFLTTHVKAHAIFEGDRLVGLATETDEEMDRVCEFLERERGRVPGFQFMRNTIYVRFCHEAYSKGTALGELGRLTGIPPEEIFAAGDHYNDLPMLDGTHAHWVMCPGNAVEAVRLTVSRAGGYVATGHCSEGLVEALRVFKAI
ncbi:MAG: HAD-superfamily hydrolase, subfamily [Chthoniobacteraceae bacterium]|nr:HAD-superfamily hydrolase, subfamily [Chthoniobacteraceae bacterium]